MHLRCPHCQNPIELADVPSAAEITCAGCGSTFHLDKFSTATWDGSTKRRIDKFELVGTLGQGAFGVVHKARDTELDRIVAIKIPRSGNVGSGQDDVDRFLREARSVAQLRFPSIITIHEVGIDHGTPYLVCDFVEGITLADHLTGRRFTFRESAQLLAEVADALQYAHSLGVVHRDVKPSNIMIRPDGTPCVMDFGLAKRDAGEITMTMDGHVLGTPAYMSPEQARGEAHHVDGRSDVYSLGVILYQLLTGELPFRGNKAMLLHQVLHDEPKAPRSLNDKIPRDLETIALKAMAKEPGRRFVSAKDLAEDLRRWLAGEPILARPIGAVERAWRWCKRNPALATASGMAIGGLLLALVTFAIAFFIVDDARQKAVKLAEDKDKLAIKEEKARTDAEQRREDAETLALRIPFEHYFALADSRPDLAVVGMASLLPKAVRRKDQAMADSLRLHLAAWQGYSTRLLAICPHRHGVSTAAINTDGKSVLIGTDGGTAQLWDTSSGTPLGPVLQHQGPVHRVALSAHGKLALIGSEDGTARLWNPTTGQPLQPPLMHKKAVWAVALSADGKTAMTGCEDATACLWDTQSGKPKGPPLKHYDSVHSVALSADGKTALTATGAVLDLQAQLWNTATGKPIGPPLQHETTILAVALSADGKTALTGSVDSTAQLWDATTGQQIGPRLRHENQVVAVALSDDGNTVLTGSDDHTGQLWNRKTGKPIGPPLQHQGPLQAVAVSADGKTALTGSQDKTAQLWDATTGKPLGLPLHHQERVSVLALSPDGKIIVTAGVDKTARIWKATNNPAPSPLPQPGKFDLLALSGDDKAALMRSDDKSVRLREPGTGRPVGSPFVSDTDFWRAVLSADGTMALTASESRSALEGKDGKIVERWDKAARLWNTATGKQITPPLQHQDSVFAIALSADGKVALTGSDDKTARLWNTATGKPIGPALQHQAVVQTVALSANGKIALTGSFDKTARLWDATTGLAIGSPLHHQDAVLFVALSADGSIALTGTSDRIARLWNTATGKPIGPPLHHQGQIAGVALSANGRIALTGSEDKTGRFWETATGKPLGPPLRHPDRVVAVAFSADAKMARTTCPDKSVRLWKVPQAMHGDPERVLLWSQMITGLEVDELTAVHVLDAATWLERRERLQNLGGPLAFD